MTTTPMNGLPQERIEEIARTARNPRRSQVEELLRSAADEAFALGKCAQSETASIVQVLPLKQQPPTITEATTASETLEPSAALKRAYSFVQHYPNMKMGDRLQQRKEVLKMLAAELEGK